MTARRMSQAAHLRRTRRWRCSRSPWRRLQAGGDDDLHPPIHQLLRRRGLEEHRRPNRPTRLLRKSTTSRSTSRPAAVYVIDADHGVIDKFDPNGQPERLQRARGRASTRSRSKTSSASSDIAVDNSGGATQGQIYVFGEGQPGHAFAPSGTELGGNFPLSPPGEHLRRRRRPGRELLVGRIRRRRGRLQLGRLPAQQNGRRRPRACATSRSTQAQPPSPTSGCFYIAGLRRRRDAGLRPRTANLKNEWEAGESAGAGPSTPATATSTSTTTTTSPSGRRAPTATPGAAWSAASAGPTPFTGSPRDRLRRRGIAVNGNTHRVYVGDCGKVDIFGPGEAADHPDGHRRRRRRDVDDRGPPRARGHRRRRRHDRLPLRIRVRHELRQHRPLREPLGADPRRRRRRRR